MIELGKRQRQLILENSDLKLESGLGLYYISVLVWDLNFLLVCLMGFWYVNIFLDGTSSVFFMGSAASECLNGLSGVVALFFLGLVINKELIHSTLDDVPFLGFVLGCLIGIGLFLFCSILLRCKMVCFFGGEVFLTLLFCWGLGVSSLCS